MSEKLDFYEVNIDYVKYLKQFDSRIPDVVYQNRNKFVCGTLFKINGLNFFAPVSSFNIKQNSNYVIEVGNVPVGSVRYSFMFPVPDSEIKQKVINNESDYQYRFLLRQELKYCNKNREVIQSKAKAIYHKALDKNTTYHKFCCDFQLLEEKCKEWIYDKTIVKHEKGIPMYKFSFQEKMTLLELTKDRHTIELFAIDHNEVIKNKATDKLKKLDEATKKISPVHEHLKKGINVPHKIYFANYHTTIRLELIKDNICYYKDELNNSIYVLERKDAHLPQVMQRMLEPYLKANEKNTNVYVLTDSELANSNYHNLLIEYQNYPERFDYVRNVSFIFDNKGNPKALKWTDDLGKRIELKKYVFRYIRDLYKRLFYARVECPRRDVHNWNKEMVAEMFGIIREMKKEKYYPLFVQIHDDQPNLFCHFHVICFYDRSKKSEGE